MLGGWQSCSGTRRRRTGRFWGRSWSREAADSRPGAACHPDSCDSTESFPLGGVALHNTTAMNNVQSGFFRQSRRWQRPAAEWAVSLLPLLTGEAPGLSPAARHRYADVHKAVMDLLGLTPEDHRQRFREATLGPDDRPFTYTQRLRDAETRWLQPASTGGSQAGAEGVILEPFRPDQHHPHRGDSWCAPHRPHGRQPSLGTPSLRPQQMPAPFPTHRGPSNVRAGALGVSADGGGPGDPGRRLSNTLPRSRETYNFPVGIQHQVAGAEEPPGNDFPGGSL